MKWLLTGMILFALAREDVKEREISVGWILLLGATGIAAMFLSKIETFCLVWNFCSNGIGWTECLLGMLPGTALCIVSLLARRHVGMGDGMTMVSLGAALGFRQIMAVLLYGSLCAGITSFVTIICSKKIKEMSLPMVLYIFLGYMLLLTGGLLI